MKKNRFTLRQKHGPALLKKDFRLMLNARFFLLAAGSLLLYSLYINFVYVKMDEKIFPVYCYDPEGVQNDYLRRNDPPASAKYISDLQTANDCRASLSNTELPSMITVGTVDELSEICKDGYSIGIDLSGTTPEIRMVSCGIGTIDNLRAAYAIAVLTGHTGARPPSLSPPAFIIGEDNTEMKSRREITAEFLFFELAAVGFLGLAAMLFKEKEMGVIRVHAILPIRKHAFILSKLILFLLCDLLFSALLTLINLGLTEGLAVLPLVLVQAGILSLLMALTGFFCAVVLPDFKQFSLLYLVLAVFITTPVFMVGQMGMEAGWIKFHPMYHLFMAMKHAYFKIPTRSFLYYALCAGAVILLFWLAEWGLRREMEREG